MHSAWFRPKREVWSTKSTSWTGGAPETGKLCGPTILSGATIEKAHLIVVEGEFDSGTSLIISAEKAANPNAPTSQVDETSRVSATGQDAGKVPTVPTYNVFFGINQPFKASFSCLNW
jgi:hypothetical protein